MAHLDIAATGADEVVKLRKIVEALMGQVERSTDVQGNAYSLFQTATLLEDRVRARTGELEAALSKLEEANRELSQAKGAAETARQHLLDAVEAISEGFALFDADDRLVLCNTHYRSYWALGEDELDAPVRFADLTRRVVDKALVADAVADPERWVDERIACHENPSDPFVIRLSDGRWLQVNERRTSDGGIVGIYTDVSDLKLEEEQRRQRELAEKSVLLQTTLDNLGQGVSVFDGGLELVAWNERFEELAGLPDGMIRQGMPYADCIQYHLSWADYSGSAARDLDELVATAPRFEPAHVTCTSRAGRTVEILRSPMPGGGFVTTYTDVTSEIAAGRQLREAKEHLERRVEERTAELTELNAKLLQEINERSSVERALQQAKTEAENANVSKTRFVAAASHDLLQPLNAARLFVSTLVERDLDARTGELVGCVDDALHGVESMLSALLDISKLDAGVVPVDKEPFPIGDLLHAIATEFGPIAAAAGLRLRLAPSRATVHTDRRLLGRIVRNLVSNAIRYTERGAVLVGCRRQANGVRLEVHDTGVGIAEEHLEDVFEEFRRLPVSTREGEKGAGLGLAIVRRIAGVLEHEVSVRSIEGKGSVFAVAIPLGSPGQPAPEVGREQVGPGLAVESGRILVIDNEPAILRGMAELLGDWGYAVEGGTGYDEAMEVIRSMPAAPDLILVDYQLDDGEDGLDCLHRVERALAQRVPAIVITADRSEAVRARVSDDDRRLLEKPVRPARLRALVSHLLSDASRRSPGLAP